MMLRINNKNLVHPYGIFVHGKKKEERKLRRRKGRNEETVGPRQKEIV